MSEVKVALADGWTLRSGSPSTDAFTCGEYVRLCRPDGSEHLYWDQEEWATDPVLVMGAIINAAAGYRPQDQTDEESELAELASDIDYAIGLSSDGHRQNEASRVFCHIKALRARGVSEDLLTPLQERLFRGVFGMTDEDFARAKKQKENNK